MRSAYRVLVGNLMERGHLEDLGVNGRIILKWIFKLEWDLSGLGQGHVAGYRECGIGPSGSIKCGGIS